MIPESLEKRNEVLYAKLVPDYGPADTLEGETLRAINQIIYRFYNDGDLWFDGYGCETAGPAVTFLRQYSPIDVRPELNKTECVDNEDYEKELQIILEKILTHIESQTEYHPNRTDSHNCKPKYKQVKEYDYD
jgi:hypothetical protein